MSEAGPSGRGYLFWLRPLLLTVFLLVFVAPLLSGALGATVSGWTPYVASSPNEGPPPAARSNAAFALNGPQLHVSFQYLVLFGGEDASGNILSDTWSFGPGASPDPSGWRDIGGTRQAPRRSGAVLAFNEGGSGFGSSMILFGGRDGSGQVQGGTFRSSSSTSAAWVPISPPVTPSARSNATMVSEDEHYDNPQVSLRTHIAVLFGGKDGSGGPLGDTWTFNGANNTWTQELPAASPPARFGAMMAYDAAKDNVVLFGGQGVGGALSDTWIWRSSSHTWQQQTPLVKPPARYGAGMSFRRGLSGPNVPVTSAVILFGGTDGAGNLLDDTWMWDGVNWSNENPATKPPARTGLSMAQSDYQGLTLFGGSSGPTYLGDTWSYNASTTGPPAPGAKPSVAAVSPSSGPLSGMQRLTVTGAALSGASVISFSGVKDVTDPCPPAPSQPVAPCFRVDSPVQVTVYNPAATVPAKVHVLVTTPAGTSDASALDLYEYLGALPQLPSVSGLNPSTGPTAGGTQVSIAGSNLAAASEVDFEGVGKVQTPCGSQSGTGLRPCFKVINTNEVVAFAPATTTQQKVHVRITTPAGQSAAAPSDLYEYRDDSTPRVGDPADQGGGGGGKSSSSSFNPLGRSAPGGAGGPSNPANSPPVPPGGGTAPGALTGPAPLSAPGPASLAAQAPVPVPVAGPVPAAGVGPAGSGQVALAGLPEKRTDVASEYAMVGTRDLDPFASGVYALFGLLIVSAGLGFTRRQVTRGACAQCLDGAPERAIRYACGI